MPENIQSRKAEIIIEARHLAFAYPTGPLIYDDFNWQASRGESWAIIGPSGCGKSTLLYLLAGLHLPTSGEIIIAGQPLRRPRPRTGLILQDYGLLPWATVWDNAALGLKIRDFYGPDGKHTPVDEDLSHQKERVGYWLRRLGIEPIARHYPGQISGGQRQRTAIARSLALNPDLLLMDEPFGALDAHTREDLQNITLDLKREQGLTTIMVTHIIEEAVFMGECILVLGRIPNHAPILITNPGAGGAAYRSTDEFSRQCKDLRILLESPISR